MDMAKSHEIGIIGSGGDCGDKTVNKLLSKTSNRAISYLILEARLAFTQLKKVIIKAPIF